MQRPAYILFAGVNGAGKSTLYCSGMWQHNEITGHMPRVNSDEILVAHGWNWKSEADQVKAGKEAVRLVQKHIALRETFNQETTLCGRSILKNIEKARDAGFYIVMFYVCVEDPQVANKRIRHRFEIGGHYVDPSRVEQRFRSSIGNLVRVIDLCNEAYLYDNTSLLSMVARFELGELAYFAIDSPGITWHHEVAEKLGYELTSF